MLNPSPGTLVLICTDTSSTPALFVKKIGNPIFDDGDIVVEVLPVGRSRTQKYLLSNLKEIK